MCLCWGRQKRAWNWELGNSSCSGHLYPGIHFSSWTTILKPTSSQLVLFKEGALKYPAKSRRWGCRMETAPPLIFKVKGPSSSLKCISELERPFPASAQLGFGRNISPRMEVISLVDQLTHWRQAASTAVPWAHGSRFWSGTPVLTTEPRPWLQPAFPGNLRGAGEDLWSHFLSTLASFFTSLKISYFHQDQFLFSAAAAVVSPPDRALKHCCGCHLDRPSCGLVPGPASPELKGFFVPDKRAGRRN